jgi:hypothetical protein
MPGCRVGAVAEDDWRVTITFGDPDQARRAARAVHEHHVEDDVRRRLGGRVAVSASGPAVFVYADAEDAAREAERVVREVLVQHQIADDGFGLDRWDPDEEEWEDASIPVADGDDGLDDEDAADGDDGPDEEYREWTDAESQPSGWEVRAELPSHHQAVEVARRLRAEGHPVFRRWRYLIVGAVNEDDASVIAQAIRQEARVNASVLFEANPFARFAVHEPGTGEAPYLDIS